MKCLETRTTPEGLRRRRYQRADGTRLTTFEVPASVLKCVGMKTIENAMAAWRRGEERRATARQMREAVAARAGVKATAVAHELGITEARVRQIRKELDE